MSKKYWIDLGLATIECDNLDDALGAIKVALEQGREVRIDQPAAVVKRLERKIAEETCQQETVAYYSRMGDNV